jgi:hypothetical protein
LTDGRLYEIVVISDSIRVVNRDLNWNSIVQVSRRRVGWGAGDPQESRIHSPRSIERKFERPLDTSKRI